MLKPELGCRSSAARQSPVQRSLGRRHAACDCWTAALIVALLFSLVMCMDRVEAADSPPTNILAGLPYAMSPPPNHYEGGVNDGSALTDGIIGSGASWARGQSVGWSWRTPVTITFDLGRSTSVDKIRIHVAAGVQAGVRLPSQIFAYGGDGEGRYRYLGSTAPTKDADSPTRSTVTSYEISFKAQRLQRIAVIVFVRGGLMFLNEIEALSAVDGAAIASSLGSLDAAMDDSVTRRRAMIDSLPGERPTGPSIARRWWMPLGKASTGGCTIERRDPWDDLRQPGGPVDTGLAALVGGADYALWKVENHTNAPAHVELRAENDEGVSTRFFALAHVQALDFSWVPDAVTPFRTEALPPNSTMTVLTKVVPHVAGSHRVRVTIACGSEITFVEIPLVALKPDKDAPPLHAATWPYFHDRKSGSVAKAMACEPDFVRAYGTDIADVPPDALADNPAARPTELLRSYFRAFREFAYITLFMDLRRPWALLDLPDDKAEQRLRSWWAWVRRIAADEAVTAELLLFPIDEPKIGDLPKLHRIRELVQRAGLNVRLYEDVENKVAPLTPADVLQVLRPTKLWLSTLNLRSKRELFSYDTRDDGKLLSVNTYYRNQGWQAFDLGLTGVGVWALWDSTGIDSPATGWNPFGRGERDFGLFYLDEDGCALPSRRLLAWRRGLDENRMLRQCEASVPGIRSKAETVLAAIEAPRLSRALWEIASACRPR